MFPVERRSKIMVILQREGRCLVGDLARELGVSEVTIRQDLDLLESQGLLGRTHGGAVLKDKFGLEQPFQMVETAFAAEKQRIAKAAAALLSAGDTVILDVGTTLTEVAKQLGKQQDLTIFTNALNIAAILESHPDITTIVTGGTLRPKQHSLVNPYADLILGKINVDIALIGISGIKVGQGVTNVNIAEAELKALFIKVARRRVVLADSSKVGKVSLAKVADLNQINLLITDWAADANEVNALREAGLEVQLV
ncbi:MAG: DeoR/GlpR family DNA-binding transcription regulator [Bacillota bacterium]|jgi:DeoR family transcriptional regulator of aga operon